jgi:DNA-binding response OmpR family regulator
VILAKSLKIVVIDDDEVLGAVLCRSLAAEGHDALAALDGREGLELLAQDRADVAIVDIFMPGKDGFAVIGEIRRSHPEVGIIAISGYDETDEGDVLIEAQKRGADTGLAKPFNRTTVLAAIQRVTSRHRVV